MVSCTGVSKDAQLADMEKNWLTLVLAVGIADQLNTVADGGRSEVLARGPGVGTGVLDLLGDGVLWDGVGRRALKEDKGDGAVRARIWRSLVPCDGERLAGRHD